ncbi:MAG: hypothetical protein JSV79_09075 [Armatimonadota bacterium]|nr:MAG: hypothetical protein JSV79_09075 [Armatimonadota bacterium]
MPVIRELDHFLELLADFAVYYNEYRGHRRLDVAAPLVRYRGQHWKRPGRSAKRVPGSVRPRHFAEPRITVHELAA